MRTTSTPCHVCADHYTDLCPGSVPECPAFMDSLDLNAVLDLFRFPVSTLPMATRYKARFDLRAVGISA